MKIEEQIQKLSDIGLRLNDGITVDDFLLSWSREEYEERSFDLILIAYGNFVMKDPWDRNFSDQAWNFDLECIEDNGDYVRILEHFHRITGRKCKLSDVSDQVDIEKRKALLRYTINDKQREFKIRQFSDWASFRIITAIMSDMQDSGFEFYGKDNGQATVWFYLDPDTALLLNNLANDVFKMQKKQWWKIWNRTKKES